MAKKIKYAVHPDFAHYPSFTFPFNGIFVGILNQFLHLDTWRSQRHIKRKAISHQVKSADGSDFEVLQFNPDGVSASEKLPAVVYFHGGAFVLTYASTHISAVDYYAQQARCRVFLVDNRLAPQHRFPKGFEDCYAAVQWVHQQAQALGVDTCKVAVMGDSAGGGFSAVIAQKALAEKLPICGQLLIYPVIDRSCSSRTATDYVDAPMFNAIANKKMWEVYLQDYAGKNIPPYAAAGDCQNLQGLPTAYVETAEFDPLCDEGIEYAKRLQAAGVFVTLHETKGTVHGYDTVPESEITKDTFKRRIEFLKNIFK